MRTVHLFPPSIFASVTASAFQRWFAPEVTTEHEHWVVVPSGSQSSLPADQIRAPGLRWLRDTEALLRLVLLPPGTRLVVHGLFGGRLYLALCLRPDLTRHASWMIWGGDLESPAPSGPKHRLLARLHAHAAGSFGQLLSVMKDDHDKAVVRFHATTRWQSVFYPGIIDDELLAAASEQREPVRALKRIVVGNSASASNRHLALLETLSGVSPDACFYLPLSYGDRRYRDQVIEAWRARFGAAVTPMLDFMSLPDYARFLASVDCGVYYYERQQGLGNILMLLALGKPVYLLEGSQTERFLSGLGFAVRGVSLFARELGGTAAPELLSGCAHNRELCLRLFSDRACRQAWSRALGIRTAQT